MFLVFDAINNTNIVNNIVNMIKMNAFNAESIDSLFVEIGGESGAIVYIDQVEIVPVYVDKNRDENI